MRFGWTPRPGFVAVLSGLAVLMTCRRHSGRDNVDLLKVVQLIRFGWLKYYCEELVCIALRFEMNV